MIAIVNISKGSPFGIQEYEVRINMALICTFKHKREDGLAACLKKAAAAVEKAMWEEAAKAINQVSQDERGKPRRD